MDEKNKKFLLLILKIALSGWIIFREGQYLFNYKKLNIGSFGVVTACISLIVISLVAWQIIVWAKKVEPTNLKVSDQMNWGILFVLLLGSLVFIVLPRYEMMVANENKTMWKSNVGILKTAASIYYGDSKGVWPPTLDVLVPKYLDSIPKDPTGNRQVVSDYYDGTGGWVYAKETGNIRPNFPTPTP